MQGNEPLFRNRRDTTPLPEENDTKRTRGPSDTKTGSDVGRQSDAETESEVGLLTSPSSSPHRSTLPVRSKRITYQPDRYDTCAR